MPRDGEGLGGHELEGLHKYEADVHAECGYILYFDVFQSQLRMTFILFSD